jgi:oxygen-independent coproporphyrinogen-3 oxidase
MGLVPAALYIHIPFCQVRCTYCAFNIYTRRAQTIPAYLDAMYTELRWVVKSARQADQRVVLDTIYIGGGTPSLLSSGQITQLLENCRAAFTVTADAEITLEVNPDDGRDAAYFSQIRAAGVNRLSIGMQSADDDELRRFARRHRLKAVIETVSAAREAGHDNISLDLIYGAPLQTLASWQITLDAALALKPDHLSLYALQVEPGTTMSRWIAQGHVPVPDDDLAADMYELADQCLTAAGLAQYEISTWARSGHECLHNLHYWHNHPFIGIGAGAHGSAAGGRYRVISTLDEYIQQAISQDSPRPFPQTATTAEWIATSPDQVMDETLMTELRLTQHGLNRAAFNARFGIPVEVAYAEAFQRVAIYDLLDITPERIRLRPAARLISNQILMHFMRNPA